MTRVLFLFITFISFNLNILGQNNQFSRISLRATTSVSGGEYFIDILPYKDSTKIIFKIKQSINQSQFESDSNGVRYRHILKLVKNFTPNNDTVKTYLSKLDSINLAYTIYNTDSLIISNFKNENYLNLIGEVLDSPTEILENKKHLVLDGTNMIFKLTKNGISRNVFAHSPTLISNPILYKLVTETTSLYRKIKMNDFLNKTRTYGY